MPAESSRAVFLSYASQDAEAARRICETLRGAGVEVWFDADGGLEHGDEWDAKIRRQIKECVLFIPIISAHTQARLEGYFRLEWELAAQRAMSIASGVPFILPVVIDDTREPEALVPDRFRAVQWTKLPGGVVTPEVKARYLKLWSHRIGAVEEGRFASAQDRTNSSPDIGAYQAPLRRGRWFAAAIAIAAGAGIAVWFFAGRNPSAASHSKPDSLTTGSTKAETQGAKLPSAQVASEARALIARARVLFENRNFTRDDLALAEDYCRQALKLDANDAEVWAAYSLLSAQFIGSGTDRSPERVELARTQAERALKLNPRSIEARLAKAVYLRRTSAPGQPEAERLLTELAVETPNDPRVLINLGKLVWGATGIQRNLQPARVDEALALFARAAEIPAGRGEALSERGWLLCNLYRFDEADAAIAESLRVQPTTAALILKMYVALLRGDAEGAANLVDHLSDEALHSDFGATNAIWAWFCANQPDKVLRLLDAIPRDYLAANGIAGTTDSWRALAYHLQGKEEAARSARELALKVVEKHLLEQPRTPLLLIERAWLLALLGQREAATVALQLYDQMFPDVDAFILARVHPLGVHALLDPPDAVLDRLEAMLQGKKTGFLRTDLRFEPLRGNPRFQALVRKLEGIPDAKAAVDDKSVAVLPFANLSGDPAQEYFSDGLTEEILNALQRERDLRVPGRASSFSFKGRTSTTPEIARALNVAQVVEGSVRKSGNQVRIAVTLTRAADGFSEPIGTFTEELKDIFALQETVAAAVVKKLTQRTSIAAVPVLTRNPAAYESYLLGVAQFNDRTGDSLARSIASFERAVQFDAAFAPAHARLSETCTLTVVGGYGSLPRDATIERARRAARTALTVDESLAEAHEAEAYLKFRVDWDWPAAEKEFLRALALKPGYARAHESYALFLAILGRLDEALKEMRKAEQLEPLSASVSNGVGRILHFQRQYEAAAAQFHRTLALHPEYGECHYSLGTTYVKLGRLPAAITEFETAARMTGGRQAIVAFLGMTQAMAGNRAAADRILAEIQAVRPAPSPYNVGMILMGRGAIDEAVAKFEEAYAVRDGLLLFAVVDPINEPVWPHPRFAELARRIGLPTPRTP